MWTTLLKLLPWIIGGAWAGAGELNKIGERKLSRAQLRLQEKLLQSTAEANERQTKEARASTEKYLKALMEQQVEERREGREDLLMQSFMGSQDRQMALILEAMRGVSANAPQARMGPAAGMVGLMRSNL